MRKNKIYFMKLKSFLMYTGIIMLITATVINSESSIKAVKDALIVCYQTLIPSLFPFFVLSGLLINTGFVNACGRFLSPVIRPLFRVSGSGAIVFIIGIISGYPMGAKMVSELYENGIISKTEGERLLPFCNNSGPLFVISAVGIGMLKNSRLGILLYVIHVLSALVVGFIFRLYGKNNELASAVKPKKQQISLAEAFTKSVSDGVNSILLICGFVALFFSFSQIIKPFIDMTIKNETINLLFNGMLEITMGSKLISQSGMGINSMLTAISFLIGFGGICVHLQVIGIVSKCGLSIKTYLYGKSLQSLISAALMRISLKFIKSETIAAWKEISCEINSLFVFDWKMLIFAVFIILLIFSISKRRKHI